MFRFEQLEVWQRAAALSSGLFAMADALEQRRLFRWAEQLRAAVLSISNNIAEGSGSFSKAEFSQFLNFSRRSAFETANILILLKQHGSITDVDPFLVELDEICRMITSFRKSLL